MIKTKKFFALFVTVVAVAALSSLAYADLKPGTKAPDYSLPTLDGKTFTLSSALKEPAKPVVMDIWATWCGPCRREIPYLVNLHKTYKDKVQFIGVSVDTTPETVKSFVKSNGIGYTIALDPKASKIGGDYKVEGFPTLYLIDKKGVIRYVHIGFYADKESQKTEVAQIENEIKGLIAE